MKTADSYYRKPLKQFFISTEPHSINANTKHTQILTLRFAFSPWSNTRDCVELISGVCFYCLSQKQRYRLLGRGVDRSNSEVHSKITGSVVQDRFFLIRIKNNSSNINSNWLLDAGGRSFTGLHAVTMMVTFNCR